MHDAEPRAVATGCQHSTLKVARMLYIYSTDASGRYHHPSAVLLINAPV